MKWVPVNRVATLALLWAACVVGCDEKKESGGAAASGAPSATAAAAQSAAATATAAAGGGSKSLQAAMASRKCRHPEESDDDRAFKAKADAAELDKMKLSDQQLDCFINCKSKDDAEKCEAAAMKK